MFFMRRKSWSNRVRSVRPFRPSLERLEDRLTPTLTFSPVDTAGLISALQAAADNVNENTIINLKAGTTYDLTQVNNYWYGPDGLPPIESNVTIHGNGAIIQRDASASTPDFRLFYVSGGMELSAGTLAMDNVTLEGGIAKGGDSAFGGGGLGAGGAIFNQGRLTLIDVTMTNNKAEGGNSGVTATSSFAGGGMGGNASNSSAGGFGGSLGNNYTAGVGGADGDGLGGGGGGFLYRNDGANGSSGGTGGGIGGFGSGGTPNAKSDGGYGGGNVTGLAGVAGIGGAFGQGGGPGDGAGGGGVGGGGGGPGSIQKKDSIGAGGGFGGGGGAGWGVGGAGGFGGGGGGAEDKGDTPGTGGFGGGTGGVYSSNFGGGGGGAGLGGAIFNMGAYSANDASGSVELINCTLAGNYAYGGDSTIPAPFAAGTPGNGGGGGIFNLDGGVELDSDTLVGNHAFGATGANGVTSGDGAGDDVFNLAFGNLIDVSAHPASATLTLYNNIIATSGTGYNLINQTLNGNTASVLGSHNLVMSYSLGTTPAPDLITLSGAKADPKLSLLQNNGGLTPTMMPLPGSPVLGAGAPTFVGGLLSSDQRGVPRPPNGPVDLGSVQVSVALKPTPKPIATPAPASTSADSATAASPPSLFQALISLYLDGFALELENLAEQFATNIDEGPLPTQQNSAAAAAAGFNYNAIITLSNVLFSMGHGVSASQIDIQHNLPYAGPFGLLVVEAGVQAAEQAVHS